VGGVASPNATALPLAFVLLREGGLVRKAVDLVPWRASPQWVEAQIVHTRKGFMTWTRQLVWVHQRGGVVWRGYKNVYLPYFDGVAECTFAMQWRYCSYDDRGKCWHVHL